MRAIFSRFGDGTVRNASGKIIFFSLQKFLADICEGEKCFICGKSPSRTKFNDEHVLPDWILRRYSLHNQTVSLPNKSPFRYGQYKIACCKKCNSSMGEIFEDPIRNEIDRGYDSLIKYVERRGTEKIFSWLALIFIKCHLRDKHLRLYLDRRKGDEPISKLYHWKELHHVHCVARSFFSKARFVSSRIGSLIILKAKTDPYYDHFDFRTLSEARTILLRLGDICLIAVLNDSAAALRVLEFELGKITGSLSPIQLRELMARVADINLRLKLRPKFYSEFDGTNGTSTIRAIIPAKLLLRRSSGKSFGNIFFASTEDMLQHFLNADIDEIRNHVKNGKYTFLFNQSGSFITNSMEPI